MECFGNGSGRGRGAVPRLLWISPGRGLGQALRDRLADCVAAGLPAFQLRERTESAADLLAACRMLRPLMRDRLFLVNDRVDVARTAGTDGVHLGSGSLPVSSARALLGEDAWISRAVHSMEELDEARGADFVLVSPVFPVSKPGEPLGLAGLEALVRASAGPVLALGGVVPERVEAVLDAGAHGVAVLGAIADAGEPGRTVESFLEKLG